MALFVDAGDRLHVRDGAGTWSTFTAEFEFLGKTVVGNRGNSPELVVVLDEGVVLTAEPVQRDRDAAFHIADLSGKLVRSFARVDRSLLDLGLRIERPIAYAGGRTFWAAPVRGDPRGYTLELWSTDGRLLRVFERDVPWFPASAQRRSDNARATPAPSIELIHLDHSGLLLVVSALPNDDWIPVNEQSPPHARYYDLALDVIDTRSAMILVSEVAKGMDAERDIPRGFFAGDRQGYEYTETERGLAAVKIMEYALVRR